MEVDYAKECNEAEKLGSVDIQALQSQEEESKKELAKLLNTSQQQISRLESASYEGHSLSMLRRVAVALHARVRVVIEPVADGAASHVAEDANTYCAKCR